ncbi:MAG TPA: peptide chain release factor-like protein [Dissulfurispiraceae bacterium]|nr:peptide chain release factor-like protein [Dissulfurispiraceae bacterium]
MHIPLFAVSDEKNRQLLADMQSLGISEADIEEIFIRSSGKGGQHVNKTSSCVYLIHKPTGIEIKCMRDRSQSINRFLARRELIEKIKELKGMPTAEEKQRQRIRKQKQRRKSRHLRKEKPEILSDPTSPDISTT